MTCVLPSCFTSKGLCPLCEHKDLCSVWNCARMWYMQCWKCSLTPCQTIAFVPLLKRGKKKKDVAVSAWAHKLSHYSQTRLTWCLLIIICCRFGTDLCLNILIWNFFTLECVVQAEPEACVGVGMGCTLSWLWKHNKRQPASKSGIISKDGISSKSSCCYLFLHRLYFHMVLLIIVTKSM